MGCAAAARPVTLTPMPAPRERISYRGFDLRLENGFAAAEARAVVDRVLATGGDRVGFLMDRPGGAVAAGRPARLFVKAEFRRPDQALGKRLRPSRAISEGRGYRRFAAAGLPVVRLFAFGEQSRLRPRAGAIVVTEKVRGRDAARTWKRSPSAELAERAARTLAAVHAAGFVHGDAVMRNFVLVTGREYLLDLPGWCRWTAEGAERDLSLLAGSLLRLGADDAQRQALFAAYESAPGGAAARLAPGWRERALAAAEAYVRHLQERDATRPERRARKQASIARPGERGPSRKEGSP